MGLVLLAVYFVGQYSVGIFADVHFHRSDEYSKGCANDALQEMRPQNFLDTQRYTAATCPRAACGRVESDFQPPREASFESVTSSLR